jgi:hypothetical protein
MESSCTTSVSLTTYSAPSGAEYVVKITLVVQLDSIEGAEDEVKLTLVVQLDSIEGEEYVVKLTLVVPFYRI